MSARAPTPAGLHIVWLLLVVATLGSFGVAEFPAAFFRQPLPGVAAVLLVAAFKARLILQRFMELRHGPIGLRVFFDLWVLGCAAMIVGFYWHALGTA